MLKKLFIVSTLITTILAVSCSKNDDNNPGPSSTHKVVFKAETNPGGSIQTASYGIDGDARVANDLTGKTWTSPELTAPAGAYNANILVNATGANNATVLKVQIYVDCDLKKEMSSNPGNVLSVIANYKF